MREPRGRWQCRMDRVWCYVPALLGWFVFALLLGLSLFLAQGGDLRRIKPRQVLDGMIIWFCLGPVLVGTVRGWRKTIRRRIRQWVAAARGD